MYLIKGKYYDFMAFIRIFIIFIFLGWFLHKLKITPGIFLIKYILMSFIFILMVYHGSILLHQLFRNYHIHIHLIGSNRYIMSIVNSTIIGEEDIIYWALAIITYNKKLVSSETEVIWSSINKIPLLHFVCTTISLVLSFLFLIIF